MARNDDEYLMDLLSQQRITSSFILELIRRHTPITYHQLAEKIHIKTSKVKRIVNLLINDGWVIEERRGKVTNSNQDAYLIFDGTKHLAVGIDLGGTKLYGAVVDFDGNIKSETYILHHKTKAEESQKIVCHVIDKLLKEAQLLLLPVEGIGIGVPGITNPETGRVSYAPALGWQEYPLRDNLQKKYPYPILIENDVNLASLGEAWFGSTNKRLKDSILVAIGTGIGAGIIKNGRIHTGVHHMAGEIGYLLLEKSHLGKSYPDFGAFEQIASGTGIAERARALMVKKGLPVQGDITAEYVFTAARKSEEWAEEILSETIDYLALAVAALMLIFDPEMIVIGGGVSHSGDMLIQRIVDKLQGAIPILPELMISQLGHKAAILGVVIQLHQ